MIVNGKLISKCLKFICYQVYIHGQIYYIRKRKYDIQLSKIQVIFINNDILYLNFKNNTYHYQLLQIVAELYVHIVYTLYNVLNI